MSDIVRFKLTNGEHFGIYRQTLDRYPNSFLTKLVAYESKESFHSSDQDNAFIIDEDPLIFASILNYYRSGVWTIENDELQQAIIDKYMLPTIDSTSKLEQKQATINGPMYVHLSIAHPVEGVAVLTRPTSSEIPALHDCPFVLSRTNVYKSKDPIELANYLAENGYIIQQMDVNSRTILMKRKC